MQIILSTTYFPPINYFYYLIKYDCLIDINENFQKQSYRNRCVILGANGKEQLIIPVKHQSNNVSIQYQEISYTENWQIKHWRSITSAYNHAPFFEFYKDEIYSILMEKNIYLFELNYKLIKIITSNLEIKLPSISLNWEKLPSNCIDKRNEIHPKREHDENYINYNQVFSRKFGFTSNLSILDLLFNLGPDAHLYLLENIK